MRLFIPFIAFASLVATQQCSNSDSTDCLPVSDGAQVQTHEPNIPTLPRRKLRDVLRDFAACVEDEECDLEEENLVVGLMDEEERAWKREVDERVWEFLRAEEAEGLKDADRREIEERVHASMRESLVVE